MSEQLKGHDSNIKATKWDDLSEVGFAGEEQTSPERSLLESETQEKIKNNPGAKKALRRLIIGAVAALTLFTGNTIKNHEVAKEISAENEEKCICHQLMLRAVSLTLIIFSMAMAAKI